jgi:hypothetical protein
MGKRNRDGCPKWWKEIEDEIHSKDGHIHSSVKFCANSRQLMVGDVIDEGTVLLKIPSECLVSKQWATRLIPGLQKLEEKLTAQQLFSSPTDVLIALSLATTKDFSLLPYLHTLPDRTTFDSLPRRWNDTQIEKLLEGSPLVERIRAAKNGVAHDYEIVKQAWEDCEGDPTTSFPSLGGYSDMLAAVSSRAFMVRDSEEDVAMVPVLDLCDHYRGQGSKKNVSYKFQEDGSVEVKSTTKIEKDGVLRITYGSLGNGQLLFNYGFAIPRNLEPDGSSNDTLELRLNDTKTIHLRTGPKSYTYGRLVQAMEHFMVGSNDEDREESEEQDDMEAFLNGCYEEVDIYGENDDEADGIDEGSDDSIQEELDGLKLLRKKLGRRFDLYGVKGVELNKRLSMVNQSSDFYAALLVHSEQRTLYFFTRAIEKLEARLKNAPKAHHGKFDLVVDQEDLERIESQTDQLVDSYIKIRHGDTVFKEASQ